MIRGSAVGGVVLVMLALSASPVLGQLLAPGKLIKAHGDLEGVRHCTKCHQLGQRGVSNDKCLDCHEELAHRITRSEGFHATIGDKSCGECHKDHFGPDFDAIHLDTAAFDHGDVGFDLVGGHRNVACRECHRPEYITDAAVRTAMREHGRLASTFLGLGTTCLTCHRNDDPHNGQFGTQPCENCHAERDWKRPNRFDHSKTRYPLTGRHRDVACERCHPPVSPRSHTLRLTGLAFGACADCHTADDPHKGRFGETCSDCHTTGGWNPRGGSRFEAAFDHSKTRFALRGKHARVECAACHSPARARAEGIRLSFLASTRDRTYPVPVSAHCGSCHTDYHRGAFAESRGGAECRRCHTDGGWVPTTYDIARHNRDARYALTGAHLATPCAMCHKNPDLGQKALQFRFKNRACVACHRADDPHGKQFPNRACDDCHETRAFTIRAFDHTRTRYPLDGKHRTVPCASCHPLVKGANGHSTRIYRPLGTACRDCHEGGTP